MRDEVARGKPVLVLAAHQCNWEWMLLGAVGQLGMPVDAAYKPLVRQLGGTRDAQAALRVRRAHDPRAGVVRRHHQAARHAARHRHPGRPGTEDGERKHWVRFLNRDSAFFVGPEGDRAQPRVTRRSSSQLRRTARGHYEVEFVRIAAAGEQLPTGEFTARYARMVEEQIRAAPADWPWSHKRWKLKKAAVRLSMGTVPIRRFDLTRRLPAPVVARTSRRHLRRRDRFRCP